MPASDPTPTDDCPRTTWIREYRLYRITLGAAAFNKSKYADGQYGAAASLIKISEVRDHAKKTAKALNAYNAATATLKDGRSLLENETALLRLIQAAEADLPTIKKNPAKKAAVEQVIADARAQLAVLEEAWAANFDCEKPAHDAIEPEGGWEFAHGKKTRTGKMMRAAKELNALGDTASLEQQHALLQTIVQNGTEWLLDAKHMDSKRKQDVLGVLKDAVPKLSAVAAVHLEIEGESDPELASDGEVGLTNAAKEKLRTGTEAQSFSSNLQSILEASKDDTAATATQAAEATAEGVATLPVSSALEGALSKMGTFFESPAGQAIFGGLGVLGAFRKLLEAWNHRKAYKAAMKKDDGGEMQEVARYAFLKVKRRFALRLKDFAFSVVKTAMHILTVTTGGAVAIFAEALSVALTVVDVVIKLGQAVKKLIKWVTGRLGKSREANAGRIVAALRDEWGALMAGGILDPDTAEVTLNSQGAQAFRMVTGLGIQPHDFVQDGTFQEGRLRAALMETMRST